MRPGPGLVVMALAFISGARRGSTSTSSKISSSSTSSSPSSSYSSSSSSSSSASSSSSSSTSDTQLSAASILFPSFLGGGGVLTPTDSPTTHQQREINAKSTNDYNHFYYKNYPPPAFVLPEHLRQHYDDPRARSESLSALGSSARAAREAKRARSLSTGRTDDRSSDIVGRAGGGGGGDGSSAGASAIGDDDTSDSSSAADISGNRATAEGLLVQYPSRTADSSRSFDEDNIFALVAEDDLLSEESFDRLTKLTDDKIGYINEEDDYSGIESVGGSSGTEHSFAGGVENQQQDESHSADDSSGAASVANVYAANLVSNDNNNNNIAALVDSAHIAPSSTSVSSTADTAAPSNKLPQLRKSIFESKFPLTRLNPWISACDLAQPGIAPDLQGQCSAGTLPVAWVDEGPGPPTLSCEQLRINNKENMNNFNDNIYNTNTNNNNNNIKTNNNKVKYLIKENTINSKLNNNNNNFYNNKIMTKVRREVVNEQSNNNNNADAESERLINKATGTTATATTTATAPTDSDAMQQDGIGAIIIQQSQNNNNIVKMSATNGNTNVFNNLNLNAYELKYNHQRQDQDRNANASNKLGKQNANERQQQHQQQKEQEQQCLYHLGDSDETNPTYLCSLHSASELVERLRTLRLKHCSERNVFSALHTIALNATLGGGDKCVRILTDAMELDSLANRITCELAEILFRFDCRQVYSLVNQCNDCKEAYRRWVCSTLIPHFAEPSDIKLPQSKIENHNNANVASNKNSTRTTTSNFNSTTNGAAGKHSKNMKLIDDNNNSNNNNQLKNANYGNQRSKRHISSGTSSSSSGNNSNGRSSSSSSSRTAAETFFNIIEINSNTNSENNNNNYEETSKGKQDADGRCKRKQQQKQPQQEQQQQAQQLHLSLQHENKFQSQQQQSNNFISTANSEDPCSEDPVISKLLKRSKRKVEFRKRRRIRPCLTVCQTVEQKCPYLLPADRAPALPTQYAGEPTFLCSDQSIAETGEQLRRSVFGPPECCYFYCGNGICTSCDEFAMADETAHPAIRRVHNITLTVTNQHRQDARLVALANETNARSASIAIALQNATGVSSEVLDGLPYYAYYAGTYYYDDDAHDMPIEALSEYCPAVPSVTTRCTIPYYASSATSHKQSARCGRVTQQLLLWLSTLLCLLGNYNALQQRRHPKRLAERLAELPLQADVKSCRRGAIMTMVKLHSNTSSIDLRCLGHSGSSDRNGNGTRTNLRNTRRSKLKLRQPRRKENIYKLSKVHFSSKIKLYRSRSSRKLRDYNITSNFNIKLNINTYSNNSYNKNYRFFYYYNFNINDWWRRWWIREPLLRRSLRTS